MTLNRGGDHSGPHADLAKAIVQPPRGLPGIVEKPVEQIGHRRDLLGKPRPARLATAGGGWLTIGRDTLIRVAAAQTHGMFIQGNQSLERAALLGQAHRRVTDSILFVMTATVPTTTPPTTTRYPCFWLAVGGAYPLIWPLID